MTAPHEHTFGPLCFGRRLGVARWEGLKDPCTCGLTFDAFLRQQFAQMQAQTEMLVEAMRQENVPSELASRILNRYLFGNPAGLPGPRDNEERWATMCMDREGAHRLPAEAGLPPMDGGRPLAYDPRGVLGLPSFARDIAPSPYEAAADSAWDAVNRDYNEAHTNTAHAAHDIEGTP